MEVFFTNRDLETLYVEGHSRKLKLPNPIIDKFFATVQLLEAAQDIYDIWKTQSLRFKKLNGFENRYSVRLNNQYRLEMDIDWLDKEQTVGRILLDDISNHYGD